ncbi:MAG: glycoside hydrolase family 38 [Spirochaetia bacterium]|nr:glycoside hydrolase family 38 [Spirochaetia bacterium]
MKSGSKSGSKPESKVTFHLLANAHLDPVWLWDWREGLGEGLTTCRTILDLMDEFPELTFVRGEAAVYSHIEQTDPKTFARIKKMVKAGRWDVVGGTWIQPDTNLPDVETLRRQFEVGGAYFKSRFGKKVEVAWAADSFGHSAGLPEILASAGIENFAFTRPQPNILPLAKSAFWWEGPGGARILAYRPSVGWYGMERDEVKRRLDGLLVENEKAGLSNVGVFYGLGNHGGGPSRRHLKEIGEWAAAHPEVRVVHSGFHRMFGALREEGTKKGPNAFPVHKGEMNYCLRGCYSALAKFKFPYRKTESHLRRAEKTDTLIHTALSKKFFNFEETWGGMLFNSFHDILPGSSIERAFEDQIAWTGGIYHTTQKAEARALFALASEVDTRVLKTESDHPTGVPFLLWNPHPFDYEGPVEIEAALDYRPLWEYRHKVDTVPVQILDAKGEPLPFQLIPTEHSSMPDLAWRKRAVVPVRIPAGGWTTLQMGWVKNPRERRSESGITSEGNHTIGSKKFRIEAVVGEKSVRILDGNKNIFGAEGMQVRLYEDPWGSWGGMSEEPDSIRLKDVRETFTVSHAEVLERGPERASLWVRFAGKNSRLDLTFSLCSSESHIRVKARVFLDDRSARLKMIFPGGDQAAYEVPGAVVERGPAGEVPGGKWVRVHRNDFGFLSNALYNFDAEGGEFRATVARASRYANDVKTSPDEELWRPAVDSGELNFEFWLTSGRTDLGKLALMLEEPPVAQAVTPGPGRLGRSGSFFHLETPNLQILSLKKNGSKIALTLQNKSGDRLKPRLQWMGKKESLGEMKGWEIRSFELKAGKVK